MIPLVFLVFLTGSLPGLIGTETAQWRGPERDGIYPETNLLTSWPAGGPKLLWKYEHLGKGYSSAAVTSARVFTAGSIDSTLYIFSFDLNGKFLWKSRMGPEWTSDFPGTRSTPLIADGLGYIVSGLGALYCFETQSGAIKWKKDLFRELDGRNCRWGFTENLVIDGNRLFCTPGGRTANVVALDRLTGRVIWKSGGKSEVSACCSPILIERGGRKYFITMTESSVISLDAETGALIWSRPLHDDTHANTPMYRDGILCLYAKSSEESGGVALKISEDGKSVQEAWSNPYAVTSQGDGVLIGNTFYMYSPVKKKVYGFDWKTGAEKFSYPLNTPLLTLVSANGMLYCYTFTGDVYLFGIDTGSFELKGKFTLPGNKKEHCAHPVIKEGKLFMRIDEVLFVYSIAKPAT